MESLGKGHASTQYRPAGLGRLTSALLGLPYSYDSLPGLRGGPLCLRKIYPSVCQRRLIFQHLGNPLTRHKTWKHVACPQCGGEAQSGKPIRWILLWILPGIFCDSLTLLLKLHSMLKPLAAWVPVQQYIGGVEHGRVTPALCPLFYAGPA